MSTENPAESENLVASAIDAAEEICDPLDQLVKKTAIDPGAPFAPDTLERIAALKKELRLRQRLRAPARARLTQLWTPTARPKSGARSPAMTAMRPRRSGASGPSTDISNSSDAGVLACGFIEAAF
jgi:hypothetical protein